MNIHLNTPILHNSCKCEFLHMCVSTHSHSTCGVSADLQHTVTIFGLPPATSRVPLHQGHNGAIRRLIMTVWSTGRAARRQSRTASLMAHYSLLNDHTDDPNSVAGCPHSACLKQHLLLSPRFTLPVSWVQKVDVYCSVFVMVCITFPRPVMHYCCIKRHLVKC